MRSDLRSPENSEMYPECFIVPWDAIAFLLDAANINRRPISSVGSVLDYRAGGRGFEPWLFTIERYVKEPTHCSKRVRHGVSGVVV